MQIPLRILHVAEHAKCSDVNIQPFKTLISPRRNFLQIPLRMAGFSLMKEPICQWGCAMDSPVGELTLLASDKGLSGVYFEDRYSGAAWEEDSGNAFLARARQELREYFAGDLQVFSVPLDPAGTEFRVSVWRALDAIPFGEVRSYGEIADAIDNPKAVRAVGLANGANPISIITPCHRVIGVNGKLTGYGGGLERKLFLLKHENAGFLC